MAPRTTSRTPKPFLGCQRLQRRSCSAIALLVGPIVYSRGATLDSLGTVDALKAMHIIPRTPPPVPLEERDPATLSIEDMVELQRRLRELRVSQSKIFKCISTFAANSQVGC